MPTHHCILSVHEDALKPGIMWKFIVGKLKEYYDNIEQEAFQSLHEQSRKFSPVIVAILRYFMIVGADSEKETPSTSTKKKKRHSGEEDDDATTSSTTTASNKRETHWDKYMNQARQVYLRNFLQLEDSLHSGNFLFLDHSMAHTNTLFCWKQRPFKNKDGVPRGPLPLFHSHSPVYLTNAHLYVEYKTRQERTHVDIPCPPFFRVNSSTMTDVLAADVGTREPVTFVNNCGPILKLNCDILTEIRHIDKKWLPKLREWNEIISLPVEHQIITWNDQPLQEVEDFWSTSNEYLLLAREEAYDSGKSVQNNWLCPYKYSLENAVTCEENVNSSLSAIINEFTKSLVEVLEKMVWNPTY